MPDTYDTRTWDYWSTNTWSSHAYTTTSGVWPKWTTGNTACTSTATITWRDWARQASTALSARTASEIARLSETAYTFGQDSCEVYRPSNQVRAYQAQAARTSRFREPTAAQQQLAQAAFRKAKRVKRVAKQKARAMLWGVLNPEQRQLLRTDEKFQLRGPSGKLYEIDVKKMQHNIYELDADGKRVAEMCCYTSGGVPLADNALGQMLHLLHNEEHFRQIANHRRMA